MRKAKREQVLAAVQLMHKAHAELRNTADIRNQKAAEVLAACRECAVLAGMEIECSEGQETRTARLLEDYCGQLCRCIQPGHPHNGADIYKELENCLDMAEKSFREEVRERAEVVFLPYNASMWDSLESVWKAAEADEACDAYVVPVPYYDKNPDGTFGKLHYEGGLLPDYVPVVPWKEYDLEQRRPDMAFIHNPYDDGNIVTSVHPDYYAGELKKHVGKLVYIPYFLFVNDLVSENMVATKGVFYADFVIVQSEECCRKCIQIYDAYREAHKLQGIIKAGRDKFLPLGSPIADSMSGGADWDCVPSDWKQKIWQGSHRKKVIFYNTHLSDVMHINAERFFKKVREVLEIFRKQPDVVLLWRPHPLTWQTIQAMNPAAAEQYQEIVDNYRAEGWGIYDDTAELKRAVRIADAYYGDWSSVVTMFREAGKPVMMQNLENWI